MVAALRLLFEVRAPELAMETSSPLPSSSRAAGFLDESRRSGFLGGGTGLLSLAARFGGPKGPVVAGSLGAPAVRT